MLRCSIFTQSLLSFISGTREIKKNWNLLDALSVNINFLLRMVCIYFRFWNNLKGNKIYFNSSSSRKNSCCLYTEKKIIIHRHVHKNNILGKMEWNKNKFNLKNNIWRIYLYNIKYSINLVLSQLKINFFIQSSEINSFFF